MKILVTGGGGYIGSVASYLLLQQGHSITILDNLSRGYSEPTEILIRNFPGKVEFIKADIREPLDMVFEGKGYDAVAHYAALCSVNESVEKPDLYFSNNVAGSNNLFSYMDKYNVRKIVFSSTCAVYGEAKYVPVDEKHPTNPANPYGASKLMVEELLSWYAKLKDFHFVILRYFNVCGSADDGLVGDSKKPSVLLMQNAVRGAMGIEPFKLTCPKVDTPDGSPIRDYINVVDLNLAHLAALDYLSKGGANQIINLGTGNGNSVLEIVDQVKKITQKDFPVGTTEARKGEYAKMIASVAKANEILGWSPKRSLSDSVKSLVTWYKKYPQGYSH